MSVIGDGLKVLESAMDYYYDSRIVGWWNDVLGFIRVQCPVWIL